MLTWRSALVLLFLAMVSSNAMADDLVKLKAALAERFSAYQNLSLDWNAKTKDQVSEFESVDCHWIISSGKERIETAIRGNLSHGVVVSDGTKTVKLSYADNVNGDLSQFQSGGAHLYRGSISPRHSASNFAAYILGVICMGPGSKLVDLVEQSPVVSIDPIPINGVPCLAWSVPFDDIYGSHYDGVLVVNQAEDWLPVLWETTQNQGNDRRLVCTVKVSESVEVFDEISKTSMRVPSRGEFSIKQTSGDQVVMNRTSHVELHEIKLGKQFAPETFQVTIPPGFDVKDETNPKSGVKRYVSGGAAAEKKRFSELAAQASIMNEMREVQTVDASIPNGSHWAIWMFVAAIILAGVSLYVRRSASVLLFLAMVSSNAMADDLVKLKASLAERFSSYRTISLEVSSSGPDMGDPSLTIGSEAVWEKSGDKERFELSLLPSNDSKSVTVFDGVRTTNVWFPGPNTKNDPGYKGVIIAGSAQIHRGEFSYDEYAANAAVSVLGVFCTETGTSLLDVVTHCDLQQTAPIEVAGRQCLAWSFDGKLRAAGSFQARLAVDVEAGWLPVLWDTEMHHPGDGTVFRHGWEVTESMLVMDHSSSQRISFPQKARYLENGDEVAVVVFRDVALGGSIPSDHFNVQIPTGFRVADGSEGSMPPKQYIQGGAVAEKARLREVAHQAQVLITNAPKATVNATVPEKPNWSLWLCLGSVVLAAFSLYVRRK